MSIQMSMFFLLSVIINVGRSSRPVVTFTPNTKKIFTTEPISMTCDAGPNEQSDQKYYWFRTGTRVHIGKTYAIQSAKVSDGGSYRCLYQNKSESLRLDVSSGWVILQSPPQVIEGDNLTLRCHHYPGFKAGKTIFYKDDQVIQDWSYKDHFHVAQVNMGASGRYKCVKQVQRFRIYCQWGDDESISVQELFSSPTLVGTIVPLSGRNNMTLTCETSLHPSRQNTLLQFAFYKEGRRLKGFGAKDTHQDLQPEDFGKYSCQVKTTDGRVSKISAEEIIQIEDDSGNGGE